MRRGIQLPERADFKALPAAEGSRLAARRCGVSQSVGDRPATHRGRVHGNTQTAMNLGSGETVRSWGSSRKQFADERFRARGPAGSMIAARMAWSPGLSAALGGGTEVVGVKFVKSGASQVEFIGGGGGRQFATAKSGENFTNQRCAQTVRQLTIMFFIAAKMRDGPANSQSAIPALRAFRRPPLRSGLLQARRAGSVRLCSHTCPGLLAHCSPLLATQQSIRRSLETALQRGASRPAWTFQHD